MDLLAPCKIVVNIRETAEEQIHLSFCFSLATCEQKQCELSELRWTCIHCHIPHKGNNPRVFVCVDLTASLSGKPDKQKVGNLFRQIVMYLFTEMALMLTHITFRMEVGHVNSQTRLGRKFPVTLFAM